MDRLKQWLELAQKFQGKDFWSGVFDQDFPQNFMGNFGDFADGSMPGKKTFPPVDILENNQEIVVLVSLPGLSKPDVELSVSGNVLYLKGTIPNLAQRLNVVQTERYTGSFERKIQLPETVNSANVSAKFQDGLLEIRFFKSPRAKETIIID